MPCPTCPLPAAPNPAVARDLVVAGNLSALKQATVGGDLSTRGKCTATGGFVGSSAVLTATLNADGACTCANTIVDDHPPIVIHH